MSFAFPPEEKLTDILGEVFAPKIGKAEIMITGRCPNLSSSTYPTEIISAIVGDASPVKIFLKYEALSARQDSANKRGVSYEADIYENILSDLNISIPKYIGRFKDEEFIVFALEYLENAHRVNKAHSTDEAIVAASEWLAHFHERTMMEPNKFETGMIKYDLSFFYRWICNTEEFIKQGGKSKTYPWMSKLCLNFKKNVDKLIFSSQSIIHGEFYPANILFSHQKVYPVDWQSAAIGSGLIDLASLIEGWPVDITTICKSAYKNNRSLKAQDNFEELLLLSQIYWQFRWLGERIDWTLDKKIQYRFDRLIQFSELLNLV